MVLILAGTAALAWSIPVSLAILFLVIVLTISYRQIIFEYPEGGGAYIVARSNLGEMPALIAAAALMIDYVLTVAVSVAAGVAAITSAVPELVRPPDGVGPAVHPLHRGHESPWGAGIGQVFRHAHVFGHRSLGPHGPGGHLSIPVERQHPASSGHASRTEQRNRGLDAVS